MEKDPKKSALQELGAYFERKRQEINVDRKESQTGTFAGLEDLIKKRKEGLK